MGVVAEMKYGVQLTGDAEITGLFKPNFRPMASTPSCVRRNSKSLRDLVLKATTSQGELDAMVMAQTLAEKEAGWLVGPLQLSSLPDDILISRRFGIQQGQKIRLIDDFSQSGVYLAVQSHEAPQPQGTDVIA